MRLRFTRKGIAELDTILAYITAFSPQGARHVQDRIQSVLDLLLLQPRAGVLTSKKPLRRMLASPYPYFIYYQVTASEIVIHGVRHAARRPVL